MKPLKIYLGDLTYDTITLSTETMPLNIGYLAAYCKEKFGASIEITLFKYIEKLDKAIHDSPPDILGLGNYCWSRNVSVELFRMLKKQNPYAVTVWAVLIFLWTCHHNKNLWKNIPRLMSIFHMTVRLDLII